MGESEPVTVLDSEESLVALAERVALRWVERAALPLIVGLSGELGAGKTTWARGMLRGLGYQARVPSPTYTLLEHYSVGAVTVVHLDLYRLESDRDLEDIGIRDWLGRDDICVLAEWPERAPRFAGSCDLVIGFEIEGAERRRLCWRAQSGTGRRALGLIGDLISK